MCDSGIDDGYSWGYSDIEVFLIERGCRGRVVFIGAGSMHGELMIGNAPGIEFREYVDKIPEPVQRYVPEYEEKIPEPVQRYVPEYEEKWNKMIHSKTTKMFGGHTWDKKIKRN